MNCPSSSSIFSNQKAHRVYLYRLICCLCFSLILTVFFSTRCLAKETSFTSRVAQNAYQVNRMILKERKRLLEIKMRYLKSHSIGFFDQRFLNDLVSYYGIKTFDASKKADWKLLEKRVDMVPVSLIVAQAAYESNWGNSRFAKLANNYFGQHCSVPGCGIVPKERPKGSAVEVACFKSMFDSIRAYVHNLNTHPAYQDFRALRVQMREQEEKMLSGLTLAKGLKNYSEQKSYYVQAIQKIICQHDLERLDKSPIASC